MIKVEPGLNKDEYYKASIALADALAFGKFKKFEKLLANVVQTMSDDQGIIQGKDATMNYWREWKTYYVDTIDIDDFYRIFDEWDFKIGPCDDSSHACLKLMMKMKVVLFQVEKGRVVKMDVITDSTKQG